MTTTLRWLVSPTSTEAHIEAFKLKLATDVTANTGQPLATNTIRQRLRLLKVFFDRIIEWDLDDAPRRNPIIHGDVPPETGAVTQVPR